MIMTVKRSVQFHAWYTGVAMPANKGTFLSEQDLVDGETGESHSIPETPYIVKWLNRDMGFALAPLVVVRQLGVL